MREESQKHGLKSLKQKLISELQEDKSTFVKKRLLSRRKVFVVLDDVDTPEQLQHLVTEGIRLGPGSRVIVTSKNKHSLKAGGVRAILEVKELDFQESLKLFSLNAFKKSYPEKGYEELSERAVAYAKGLPLALKVLGLCLYCRDRKTWKDTLRKLEVYPHPQIQDVLKISYDGLDDVERDIFLDIAFLYGGEDKDHVMSLLDSNDLFPACGIKILLDKALISISNDNEIEMHDRIQEMGLEIVRQECKENPGKRSRLKDFEEVCDVLKNYKATGAIQCIVLYASLFKHVQLNVDALKNMTNLRVVKFYSPWHVRSCNVHHPTSFESFKECVEHSMSDSDVKKHWKLLQDYDISRSFYLSKPSVELPVISKAPKLEWEDIFFCESCSNLNAYNLPLSMIVGLNLVRSKDSKTLHNEGNFRSLSRNHDVSFCCSVKAFPLTSEDISDLDLSASKFKILCSSMGRLSMPRRIIQGGSRQEILPIHELCCRQKMSQIPDLPILFESLLYVQELFVRQDVLFKFPDILFKSSGLKEPAKFQNLIELSLRNCKIHLSIPKHPVMNRPVIVIFLSSSMKTSEVLSRLEDVLLSLDHIHPNESEGLAGIDQHLYHIRSLLKMKSKEVQILGIWGMSGIGKTTIAQVAYDKFSPHFEGSYFLDNVTEESHKHGLKSLKQKLTSELQELFMRQDILFKFPDIFFEWSGLKEPARFQNLVELSLRNCRMPLSIPRLPQSLVHFGAFNFISQRELDEPAGSYMEQVCFWKRKVTTSAAGESIKVAGLASNRAAKVARAE